MREPKEPKPSCPMIDSAIQELEDIRAINSELRDWGQWWKNKAEELENDLEKLESDKDKEISILEDKISELQYQLGDSSTV